MKISIASPEGNTLAALGIATGVLRQAGREEDIKSLTEAVFASKSYKEATEHITKATNGVIQFVGWPKEKKEVIDDQG